VDTAPPTADVAAPTTGEAGRSAAAGEVATLEAAIRSARAMRDVPSRTRRDRIGLTCWSGWRRRSRRPRIDNGCPPGG
jgi:hypothetical protein